MTESARQALAHLRDAGQFQWYVIPLLALVAYAYANEVEKRNWGVVFAGLTYLGLDVFIEIVNSLVFYFTGVAPVWGAPGHSAYLLLIGLNVEILLMFAMVGLVFSKVLPSDPRTRIFGIPGRLAVALVGAAFCATVEATLNAMGVLTWEYPWWNAGPALIVVAAGYFLFLRVTFLVFDLPTIRARAIAVGAILATDAVALVVFGPGLGYI